MLLLSDAAQEGRSKLLVAARDMTIPLLGTSTGTSSRSEGLREAVGELEMLVPGQGPPLLRQFSADGDPLAAGPLQQRRCCRRDLRDPGDGT